MKECSFIIFSQFHYLDHIYFQRKKQNFNSVDHVQLVFLRVPFVSDVGNWSKAGILQQNEWDTWPVCPTPSITERVQIALGFWQTQI